MGWRFLSNWMQYDWVTHRSGLVFLAKLDAIWLCFKTFGSFPAKDMQTPPQVIQFSWKMRRCYLLNERCFLSYWMQYDCILKLFAGFETDHIFGWFKNIGNFLMETKFCIKCVFALNQSDTYCDIFSRIYDTFVLNLV